MTDPLDDFLAKVLDDCVNGSSGSVYAAGIRDDAAEVAAGRSHHVGRVCPGCGVRVRSLEWDGYCRRCAEPDCGRVYSSFGNRCDRTRGHEGPCSGDRRR